MWDRRRVSWAVEVRRPWSGSVVLVLISAGDGGCLSDMSDPRWIQLFGRTDRYGGGGPGRSRGPQPKDDARIPDRPVHSARTCRGLVLNVVIYRVPRHESIVTPRSACPGCGTPLRSGTTSRSCPGSCCTAGAGTAGPHLGRVPPGRIVLRRPLRRPGCPLGYRGTCPPTSSSSPGCWCSGHRRPAPMLVAEGPSCTP